MTLRSVLIAGFFWAAGTGVLVLVVCRIAARSDQRMEQDHTACAAVIGRLSGALLQAEQGRVAEEAEQYLREREDL